MTVKFTAQPEAFVNDVVMVQVDTNDYIRLYSLNESFSTSQGSVDVNRIICEYFQVADDVVTGYSLPNIIGLDEGPFRITTEKTSVLGQVLSLDNISDCEMEFVYDR